MKKCQWLFGLFFLTSSVPAAETTYTFGIFPYLPPTKLVALYEPIAEEFEKTLETPINLRTAGDYGSFTDDLRAQKYDIAFVQPFDYVTAHDQYDYLPVARRGNDLRAIIVVAENSDIKTLEDLKGRHIVNPPQTAAVSKLTSMLLLEQGIDPFREVERSYSKSHFSCMQRVLIGKADACGTAMQALLHFESKNMKDRLRVIEKSRPIAHALFIVHKRLPAQQRDKIKQRILDWPNTLAGQKLLANGKFIPFVEASDSDYQAVRDFSQNYAQ